MLHVLLPLLVLGQTTQPSAALLEFEGVPQYAIGWGTLALINAGLAQGKNRSGLAWFVASVFLGPIATLLVVVLDKRPSQLPAA
jgi:hypothetical protein